MGGAIASPVQPEQHYRTAAMPLAVLTLPHCPLYNDFHFTYSTESGMPTEADARMVIDQLLRNSGWDITNKAQVSTEEAADVHSIPIPTIGLERQREIVSQLTAFARQLDVLTAIQRDINKELQAFMPSLLAKAFRGEL
jgi:hypothetical protein